MELALLTFLSLVLHFMNVVFIIVPLVQQERMRLPIAILGGIAGLALVPAFGLFSVWVEGNAPSVIIVLIFGGAHIYGLVRLNDKKAVAEAEKSGDAEYDEIKKRSDDTPLRDIDLGRTLRDAKEKMEQGSLDEALYFYLLAIRARPENPYAYVNAGKICCDKGWFQAATRMMDKALRHSRAITSDARRKEFEVEVVQIHREVRDK